jgi:hypothetical protein
MIKIIEVVIINWKRPKNVAQIVTALRQQTVECTITICECNPSAEFALDEETKSMADRIYTFSNNFGSYNRFVPIGSFDHLYTFFIDDDLLPGRRCLETYLMAAGKIGEFGVLGQFGRTLEQDNVYRPNEILQQDTFIETDFIIRAYFVKTCYLHNVIKFRWEIGYFDDTIFGEDDLLLCASLKYFEGLSCYQLPFNHDPETRVNKKELSDEYALSKRDTHYIKRTKIVKRLLYYGWQPLHATSTPVTEISKDNAE